MFALPPSVSVTRGVLLLLLVMRIRVSSNWVRPYLVENTISRPICEVKQPQAQLVLRSVMTWEP